MEKTKLGLAQNFEAALAYSFIPFSPITGFALLVFETENKFVRFHAMQSFIVFTFFWVVTSIASILPFIGETVAGIIFFAASVSWVVLIFNALRGKIFKFPIIGDAVYNKTIE